MKRGLQTALVVILSAGLFACGSDDDAAPTVKTGVLLDASVAGVPFTTPTQTGTTNAAGEFQFIEGEDVSFSIGGIQFPPVPAAGVVTPLQMARTTDTNNQMAINILRLLQTLDDDPTDDVITISPGVLSEAANHTADFSLDDAGFESNVAAFLNALPANPTLVGRDAARTHFEGSLFKQMAGNYSGTWTDNDPNATGGTWQFTIDETGKITGTARNDSDPAGQPPDVLSGQVSANGSLTIGVPGGTVQLTGTLTLTGEINGTWSDPPDSGTFTGKKDVPTAGGGFNAATVPGVYHVLDDTLPGVTHVYTFNADGTGVADWGDDPVDEGFTWSVDAQGRLLVDLAGLSGLPDEITLISGTPENGRISARADDDSNGTYESTGTASFVKQGTSGGGGGGGNPTLRFDAATVPGVYHIVDDALPGVTHVLTFNVNGTGVADWGDLPENDAFTWSVDALGVLVLDWACCPSALPDRMTLASGTASSGRVSAQVDDDENGVYDPGVITASLTKQ